jgi:DNA phosphorothioation-associated putative methyltransferase
MKNTLVLPKWLDCNTWDSPRWKTAIARKSMSMPMRTAREASVITTATSVLDMGCGRGIDVDFLRQQEISAFGFDPYWHYFPALLDVTDVVSCIYVLNVIENTQERVELIQLCWQLSRKSLVLAVRTEAGQNGFTSIGTYQIYYSKATFQELIAVALPNAKPKMLKSGVAVLHK